LGYIYPGGGEVGWVMRKARALTKDDAPKIKKKTKALRN
jgi:hypothetical protein